MREKRDFYKEAHNQMMENEELAKAEQERIRVTNDYLGDRVQDLEGENHGLQGSVQNLENEVEGLRVEREELMRVNHALEADNLDHRSELHEFMEGREAGVDPENPHHGLQLVNRDLRDENRDLQDENHDLLRENRELRIRLDGFRESNGELRDRNGELQAANNALAAHNLERTRRIEQVQADAVELRRERDQYERRLLRTDQDLGNAGREINRLRIIAGQAPPRDPREDEHYPRRRPSPQRGSPVPPQPRNPPAGRRSASGSPRNTPALRGRGQAPEDSPSPSPRRPRGGRTIQAPATPPRRMNTRSQVAGGDNPRTPPPALFSPQRGRAAPAARTQQRAAAKPTGVSKAASKKKGRK